MRDDLSGLRVLAFDLFDMTAEAIQERRRGPFQLLRSAQFLFDAGDTPHVYELTADLTQKEDPDRRSGFGRVWSVDSRVDLVPLERARDQARRRKLRLAPTRSLTKGSAGSPALTGLCDCGPASAYYCAQ